MTLHRMLWVSGKPYYLFKVVWNKTEIGVIKRQFPHARYYWAKLYHPRTHKKGWAVYLDKVIAYG